MVRFVSWLANAGLLVLCCFLVANTANAVFDALLTPAPSDPSGGAFPSPPAPRPWGDRTVILTRNLFNSSLLAPAPPPPQQDLEATKLPLSLLGTAASPNTALSWAAVEDQSSRRTVVVRVDDDVVTNKARVTRIERKRIVLSENGVLRELVLSAPKPTTSKAASARKRPKRPRGRTRRPARPSRAAPVVAPQPAVAPTATTPLSDANVNAAKLFSEARILPKYVDGALVGMQVNTIQPGSFFEEAGVQEGDVITEVNGITIDSPEKSAQVFSEVSEATQLTIGIDREGGRTTLNVTLPEPE